MANFIFDEGAALMSGSGLNWAADGFLCALIDDSLGREVLETDTWTELGPASNAEVAFSGKAVTSRGAVAADPIQFNSVSTIAPEGRFIGFVIRRTSDDTLIAWFDDGVNLLGPLDEQILGAALNGATVTFTVRPGISNEFAWFRP